MNDSNKRKVFYTSRPSLADILITKEFPVISRGKSPFKQDLQQWGFEISPALAGEVLTYYQKINRPTPKSIREYLWGNNEQRT